MTETNRIKPIRGAIAFMATLLTAGMLAACSDEPAPGPDGDAPESVEIPTADEVTTTLKAKTAVFATGNGRLLRALRKRIDNPVAITEATEIPAEAQLIVLDEASAQKFLSDDDTFRKLLGYYERGGMIYMDFPRLQQAAILARLIYGIYNPLPDPDDTATPLYEGYLFDRSGNEKTILDLFNPENHTVEKVDAEGNRYTEVVRDDVDLTDYLYGQFAESVVRFVDENAASASAVSRADEGTVEARQISKDIDFLVKQEFMFPTFGSGFSMPVNVKVKVRSAYSFADDKDYYEVVVAERMNPGNQWQGFWSYPTFNASWASNGGFDLDVSVSGAEKVSSLDGILPQNETYDGQRTKLEGWSVSRGVEVGLAKGVSLTTSANCTHETSVTMPLKEIKCVLRQDFDSKSCFGWNYAMKGPSFEARKNGNPTYSAPTQIATKVLTTEQGWNWTVAGTTDLGDKPLQLTLDFKFYQCGAYATKGKGNNKATEYRAGSCHTVRVDLPVPGRVKETATIQSRVSAEVRALREELAQVSPTFGRLAENLSWCAPTWQSLVEEMSKEWVKAFNEIALVASDPAMGISGGSRDITFYLNLGGSVQGCIPFYNYHNQPKGLCITTDGKVKMVP